MGWASGDEVVDPVIRALDALYESDSISGSGATLVLAELIKALQNRGWDTEEETLGLWRHTPWVVDAFRMCQVYLPCGKFTKAPGSQPRTYKIHTCSLPMDHTVEHRDEDTGYEWR